MKVLKKYLLDKGKRTLTSTDVRNLIFEAGGEGSTMEVPPDSEIIGGDTSSSAGPSTATGPSTNLSLSPETLSSGGYSESESDKEWLP
jgi:hypothetical protein